MKGPKRKRDGPAPPADLFPEIIPEETGFEKRPRRQRSNPGVTDGWKPKVDIAETTKEYLVYVETPGVKPGNISVEASAKVLSIFIERELPQGAYRHRFHKVERDFGASFRSFQIPDDALGAEPHWRVRSGILLIRLDRLGSVHAEETIENESISETQARKLPRKKSCSKRTPAKRKNATTA